VVSIYNYMQPVVAVSVSIACGMCLFTWKQAVAVVLVFSGVWLVIKSKSRRDMELKHC
jgi:drug/metabolite transporter (DMT)-like permease